ncbi:MAG TPA: ABC-type transport auxiliary lipoprotein family protein [Rhizomicrobium sp.]|jgi:cholesterol transport system auxiliary component
MSNTRFAPSRRALLVSASATLALAGCGSLLSPSNPPATIYMLGPDFGKLSGPAVDWAMVVSTPDVPNVLDTDRLLIVRNAEMDYYANAQWNDATPRLLQTLVVQAFEASGRIKGVARDSGGVRGDYILSLELRHFEAVYDSPDAAPMINVNIMAKMLALPRHDVAFTHEAKRAMRAATNTVPAVVGVFNAATHDAIAEIVDWALAAPGGSSSAAATDDAPPPVTHHRRRRH